MNDKTKIYFDYNATTPLREGVWQAMSEVATQPLNASSIHGFGREAKKILNDARTTIQKSFGAEGATVIFTSCGTESNNMALVCIKNIETIVTSEIEHVSISKPASFFKNILIPVDHDGLIRFDKLKEVCEKLKGSKYIVSIIHANNETGVIQDIKAISRIVFENGGYLHIDASQSAGKIKFDFNSLGCDMATISAHKFGGPKGASALIIKPGLEIMPFLHGGGQEKFLRAGTENIAAIVGFAKAAELATSQLESEIRYIKNIRDHIETGIMKISPEAKIYGSNVERLPNTVSVSLQPQNSETQLINFDLDGIAISAGSACSSGRVVTSHVLVAMAADQEDAKCAIRISLGWNSSLKEADQFLSIWKKNYEKNKAKRAA